jgi:hypothetical protein
VNYSHLNRSTLLNPPATACPRCDHSGVLGLVQNMASSFAWRECGAAATSGPHRMAGLQMADRMPPEARSR